MTTALTQLWALAAVSTPDLHTTIVEAMREVDAIRAERDRLIDTVARETHAAGVSATMTPEERVRAVCTMLLGVRADRDRLRAEFTSDLAESLGGVTGESWESMMLSVQAMRRDRDRLAARVAHLEAREASQHAAAREAWPASCVTAFSVQPNADAAKEERARVLLERREATRDHLRTSGHDPEADADPCPVGSLFVDNWERGTYATDAVEPSFMSEQEARRLVQVVAWLTRRVAGRGRP